ncbi:MAG: hypothetical protein AAB414_02655 [Patescibacteria group bacterium]
MHRISLVTLISLAVAITNFWIWKIIKIDLFLGLTLVLLSLTMASLTATRLNKKIFLITLLLLFSTSVKILVAGFDNNLRELRPDQQKQLNERHGYFAISLGKLFKNKFVLRFYKDIYPYFNVYASNIFNSLSPNLYFFSNHPREREKVEEFSMYPAIFLIFFLIGLLYFIKSSSYLIVLYLLFALLVTGFIKQTFTLGPVLLFPLINLLITLGILKIFRTEKNGL